MLVGAFLSGTAPMAQRIEAYRTKTGVVPAIVMFHAAWGGGFSRFYLDGIKANMQAIVEAGATPMLSWEPWAGVANDPKYALRKIIPPGKCPPSTTRCFGKFGPYVKGFAAELAEWLRHPDSQGTVVYMRLAHEMNGKWTGWSRWRNGNTNAEFKAFWKYVVSTFRKSLKGGEGATDVTDRVKWVFSPNEPHVGGTPLQKIYPGHSFVDYLGFSAYNWGRGISWGTWRSLVRTFQGSMKMLNALGSTHPIIATEMGSVEQGGSKAKWITNGFAALKSRFPRLVGVIWYDFKDRRGPDFRIDTSSSALAAWRAVVTSLFFRASALP